MSEWMTPEGITTLIALISAVIGGVVAVLERLGYRKEAKKVHALQEELVTHKDDVVALLNVTSTLIQGVQRVREDGDTSELSVLIKDKIRTLAVEYGTEPVLAPLVSAVRSGTVDAKTLLPVLREALNNMQLPPPQPPATPSA